MCGVCIRASDTHLCSEEDLEVLAVGQDGMLGYLVEEAVQGSPPRLYEVVVEALHHAFHNKLLWEGLETETREV